MKKRSEFLKLLALAKPEIKILSIATFFLILSSSSGLLYPQAIRIIIDDALAAKSLEKVNEIALWMVLILAIQAFSSTMRYYLFTITGERIVKKLRYDLFHKIANLPMSFFDNRKTGELMSRLSSDCTVLQKAVSVNLSMLVRNMAAALGAIFLMLLTSAELTLFLLFILPPIAIGAAKIGKKVKRLSRESQNALAEASEVAEENLAAMRTVKSFGQEQKATGRYETYLAKSLAKVKERIKNVALFLGAGSSLAYAALVAILWYGGRQVVNAEITVGDLTQFLLYMVIVASSVATLGGLFTDLMTALGAARQVFELMEEEPEKSESEESVAIDWDNPIKIDNLSFFYPSRKEQVILNKLNFELNPGTMTALVGSSGAGKSTITQLLLRIYPVKSGQITLGEKSINLFNRDTYLEKVGVVSQEPVLFSTTIAENIAFGSSKATMAEITEAAKAANAHDFISSFADGYDTLCGERGQQLSGGQKQRIAIARAVLKNPKLLILDEATSALDAESEYLVQEALDRLIKNRTTLVVAHRLSTVKNADNILVLQEGQIAESGTHDQLVSKPDGVYKKLIEKQFITLKNQP